MANFREQSQHLRDFKDGLRPDPPVDKKGNTLTKIPNPENKPELIACKCHSLKKDSCPFKCLYKGKQYPFGRCPICLCSCKHLCSFANYFKAVFYNEANKKQKEATDEDAAKDWVNQGVGAFQMATAAAAGRYNKMQKAGRLSGSTDVVEAVYEQGCLAQALSLVNNPPPFGVKQLYRKKMAEIQKPANKTLIDLGGEMVDVRTTGHAPAAHFCVVNNKLVNPVNATAAALGNLKNDEDYATPEDHREVIDIDQIDHVAAQVAPPELVLGKVEVMQKRVRKKINKLRKEATPTTKEAHAEILADIAENKSSSATEVMVDYASDENSSDFKDSQELVAYMTELKKKDLAKKG